MTDLAEEAVYAALLYINQRTPRPRAARALMDALWQDGYEVRPLAPAPPDALREALERSIEAMDIVLDGLAVNAPHAIVINAQSILRHAVREARAALEADHD